MRSCKKIISLSLLPHLLAAHLDIKSDEGLLGKEKSTFAGHVALEWPQKLKMECDYAEVVKKEGYILKAQERPTLRVELFDPRLVIHSKKTILDELCEKVLFIDDVSLCIDEYIFKGPNAECHLEELAPQTFSLFSSKKEGCSLSAPFLEKFVFQRVSFDIQEKTGHFFQPKGELEWNGQKLAFNADWMKIEEEGKLILDGKIVIRVGAGVYTSNGPLVLYFDPKTVELKTAHVEGKSAFSWNDYTLNLDGVIDFADEKIYLKSPEKNGIVLKYPFGEVKAAKGDITLLKKGSAFEVDQVHLKGSVFATYGIPTLQYLLADSIDIKVCESLAYLISNEKNRVLLYDQINKLEMSADQVKINWGEEFGDERIEGIGEVRFSFDQKERGLIDALFRGR